MSSCHAWIKTAPDDFSASGEVTGDHVTVVVTGEVDMSTADAMFRAATPDGAAAATLDLRAVTFFDSAAIHALIRLAERYPDALRGHPVAAGAAGAGHLRPERPALARAGS